MTLEAIGLTPVEERLYEALLHGQALGAADLRDSLGMSVRRVREGLNALERRGLVTRTPGASPAFTAAAPELAIESLVLDRMQALEDVRRTAAQLGQQYRQTSTPATEAVVELVRGYDATLAWAMQVQRAATFEVRLIDVPPYVLPPGPPNPVELDLLARGIKYRVLYHVTSFDFPAKRDAAHKCIAAGEEARVYSATPTKMIIADDKLAFAYDTKLAPVQDSLIVYPSFLLRQLEMLFDLMWSQAAPLSFGDGDRSECPDDEMHIDRIDREILALLGAGAKDETIGRQLDLGVRTVRRRVAGLMSFLGARTRFQAGVLAARRRLM